MGILQKSYLLSFSCLFYGLIISNGQSASVTPPNSAVELAKNHVTVDNRTYLYLTFDQLKDNQLPNEKDIKNPGSIFKDAKLQKGLFGNAVNSGENGYVEIARQHTFVNAMTVDFWFKKGIVTQKTTLLETIDSKGKFGWKLELLPDKAKNLLVWTVTHPDGTSTIATSNRGLLNPSQWYRVTLTFGSIYGGQKAIRIYLDGFPVFERPSYKPMRTIKGPLRIKTPPEGLIDDLAISAGGRIIYRDIKNVNIPTENLDFEQQSEGWTGIYDEPVIDTNEKHSGKYSLKIETDEPYTREYLSPIFSVKPDSTYRISFWAKVDKFEKGYSAVGVWIRWYFAPEETCSIGGELVDHHTLDNKPKTFDWKKFSADVSVPRKDFYRTKIRWARFQVKNYHSHVKVWIDDITIEEIQSGKAEHNQQKPREK